MLKIFPILFMIMLMSGAQFTAPVPEAETSADKNRRGSSSLVPRRPAAKPAYMEIGPRAEIVRVIVKLVEDARGRMAGNNILSLNGENTSVLNDIIRRYSTGKIKRIAVKSPEKVEEEKYLLESSSGHQLADMNNYFAIDISSAAKAELLVNKLNQLPIVEIAYPEPKPLLAEDVFPPTPSYDTAQFYLREAPTGVDADYGHTIPGGDGSSVRIIDVETRWYFYHEDHDISPDQLYGGWDPGSTAGSSHGTAVVGELVGIDNEYGITGIVPGAEMGMVSIISGPNEFGITEAFLIALDSLNPGDIMLIEVQSPGPRYNFDSPGDQLGCVCMEYWQANFDVFQLAWAKGAIVCQAAGNGSENLDDPIYERLFDTTYRNSHSIICGAGSPPSIDPDTGRTRLWFSNYGQRVNLQGYGRNIVTTGYGDLFDGDGFNDPHQYYTNNFGGTSSASPIVTGAVAAIQGIYKSRYGSTLSADHIRDILIATGTPQQPDDDEHIGPLPDIQAAESVLAPMTDLSVEPACIDTAIIEGEQLSVYIDLINTAPDKTLDYNITIADNYDINSAEGWLTLSDTNGTIAPLQTHSTEVILDGTVAVGMSLPYYGIVRVEYGLSGKPADQWKEIPVSLTIPCTSDTTYVIISSSDSSGPVLNWVDIRDIGTTIEGSEWNNYNQVVENPIHDGTAGPVAIGFDFPFYGKVYNNVFIGVNGAISLTDSDVNLSGYYGEISIPNTSFETFISPFWNNINIDPDSGGHGEICYFFNPPDEFIIEYFQVANFETIYDTLATFEIILNRNGNIVFQYLSVGYPSFAGYAVVGIAEYDCASAPYCIQGNPPEHMVTDSMALLFDYAHIFWEMSGDANLDNDVNVGDAVYLINWIFKGGPSPERMGEADANCDDDANVGDVVYIINYVFNSGPEPCLFEL